MPNTTAYSFGDVVLVPFPFTDQTASKKRPAVVVSADAYHQGRPDATIERRLILRKLGALQGDDVQALRSAVRQSLARWRHPAATLHPRIARPNQARVLFESHLLSQPRDFC